MPYRRSKGLRKFVRRGRAAGSIQKAWRQRKRRKIGLVQRTLMANRRNIKSFKKSVTTNVQSDIQALPAANFDGQYNDSCICDNVGSESTSALPYSPSLLRLPYNVAGAVESGRKDAWVQMKSLTMKYCITAGDRYVNQRVNMMLVLDRAGDSNDSNIPISVLLYFTGATVGPPANRYDLAFQNLDNTGLHGRFKILWKKTHMLSTNNIVATVTVPAITPAAAPATYGSERAEYDNSQWRSRSYPGRIFGSVTLKRPYKLNYGQEASTISPANQTIRLFMWQTAEGAAAGAGATLQYYTRFRYKDL